MDTDRGLLDLILERIPGLTSRDRIRLAEEFDREGDLAVLSRGEVYELLGKAPPREAWTMDELKGRAEKDALILRRNGISLTAYRESGYPPLLRELYDPPALIFYRGNLPDPGRPLAALVGTRKPTGEAQAAAFEAARLLGLNGIAVVSGLALGIDTMAHRGNLAGGAPTVAVLGSSLDQVYPASNRDLARRILGAGGAILSEYPPETGPRRWNFPARNRIIAGLARGTLVAEAPEKSGALITAQFALELGRDIWLLRAGVDSPQGGGLRNLAESGAPVIEGAGAILEEWGIEPRKTETPADGALTGGAALAERLARSLNIEGL
ncbi:MAG: DNA-processing protein DprA [Spirochaetaceae bacterium]|jgi:DNA processing protein|nr:DNA-processing protein DprA [Spirochaetaceae bacterium]